MFASEVVETQQLISELRIWTESVRRKVASGGSNRVADLLFDKSTVMLTAIQRAYAHQQGDDERGNNESVAVSVAELCEVVVEWTEMQANTALTLQRHSQLNHHLLTAHVCRACYCLQMLVRGAKGKEMHTQSTTTVTNKCLSSCAIAVQMLSLSEGMEVGVNAIKAELMRISRELMVIAVRQKAVQLDVLFSEVEDNILRLAASSPSALVEREMVCFFKMAVEHKSEEEVEPETHSDDTDPGHSESAELHFPLRCYRIAWRLAKSIDNNINSTITDDTNTLIPIRIACALVFVLRNKRQFADAVTVIDECLQMQLKMEMAVAHKLHCLRALLCLKKIENGCTDSRALLCVIAESVSFVFTHNGDATDVLALCDQTLAQTGNEHLLCDLIARVSDGVRVPLVYPDIAWRRLREAVRVRMQSELQTDYSTIEQLLTDSY